MSRSFFVVFLSLIFASSSAWSQFPGGGGGGGFGGGNRGGGYSPPSGGGYNRPSVPRPSAPAPYQPPRPNYSQPGYPSGGNPGFGNSGYQPPNPGGWNSGSPGVPGQPSSWGPPSPIRGPSFRNPLSFRQPAANPGWDGMRPTHMPQIVIPHAPGVAMPQANQYQSLFQSGQTARAREMVQQSLPPGASLQQLVGTYQSLHGAPTDLLREIRDRTLSTAQSQMTQGTGGALPFATVAGLSLETGNIQQFRQTADQLFQKFPTDPHAHLYQGIKQLQDGNWKSAEAELKKAVDLGLPKESVAELLKTAIDNQRWVWQFAKFTLYVALVWIAGIVVLYLLGRFLGNRTLRIIEDSSIEAVSEHQTLTRVYRWVVNAAGIFYYLSIPMLVVLSIMLPLSICYALLMLPYLNLWLIGLVLTTGVGGVLTAISGIRTMFAKVEDDSDELPTISRKQAPKLWQMLDGLAKDLGTRSIDTLRVTPGTDFAVMEAGSYRQRRRDEGKRVLLMGTALLNGMRQDSLRGILAHEYAHFMNRDTAGGDVAIQVRQAMGQFAEAIVQRGPIRWWDLAVQFLRLYIRMFSSLTFGASRLAEVLADRVAVNQVGRSAFADGLKHVIRRSIEWEQYIDETISQAVKKQPVDCLAFYEGTRRMAIPDREAVEAALREIWSQPSTHTDTHPSPTDRIRMADALNVDRPISSALVTEMLGSFHEELLEHMQGRMSKAVKKEAKRIRDFEKLVLESIPREANATNAPDLVMDRALLLLRRGDTSQGIEVLSEIVDAYPDAAVPRFHRALAYEELSEFEPAARDLRRVRSLINDKADRDQKQNVDLILLRVLVALKDFASAATLLKSVQKSLSDSLVVRLAAIEVEQGLGNEAKAQTHLEFVRKTWPDCPELHEHLETLLHGTSKDSPEGESFSGSFDD